MALTDDVKTILGIDGSEYDIKLALFIPFAEEMLKGKGVQDVSSYLYKIAVAIIVSEKMDGKSNFSSDLESIILQLKYCYVSTPTGVTALIMNGVIDLYWEANSESNLSGYKVYQNLIEIASVPTNFHQISGLTIGEYSFQVAAFDEDNKISKLSKPIVVEVV